MEQSSLPYSDSNEERAVMQTPQGRKGLIKASRSGASWWQRTASTALAIILSVLFLGSIWLLGRPIALLILGVATAAALAPIVGWLERWIPRIAAILLVYLALVLVFVGIGFLVIPTLIDQIQEVSDRIPEFIDNLQQAWDRWSHLGGISLAEPLKSQIGQISSVLVSLPLGIISSLLDVILVFFISIYGLVAAPALKGFICSLFPVPDDERVELVLTDMADAMGGFFRGTALDGLALGILTYFGLLIIGIDFPLALAVLTGISAFIPVLGATISGVAMVGVALMQSPAQALVVLVFVLALQQFEGHILLPNIMRTQTQITPLLAVLALFAGGTIMGLVGALAAIPLAAALRVFVVEAVAPAIRNWSGAASS